MVWKIRYIRLCVFILLSKKASIIERYQKPKTLYVYFYIDTLDYTFASQLLILQKYVETGDHRRFQPNNEYEKQRVWEQAGGKEGENLAVDNSPKR